MSDKNLCWADAPEFSRLVVTAGGIEESEQCDDLCMGCTLGLCPSHCIAIHGGGRHDQGTVVQEAARQAG